MKTLFIAWAKHSRRAEILAKHLDANVLTICHGQSGALWQAPTRYVRQATETWRVLMTERPDVVLVQNPPIFCAMTSMLYAHRYGARYILDSHSAAFLSPKWRWSLGLHRWLSRHALTTIVHNKDLAGFMNGWQCHSITLGFTPEKYPQTESFPLSEQFNVVVISSGAEDEPLDVVFEAARRLPEVTFYVTGSAQRIANRVLAMKPANCHLTGFLPTGQYMGLMAEADAVMDLTTRDHTILNGGFEAVSLGTPFITSNWPILRSYFPHGTVHVDNTVDGVYDGVRRAQAELPALQQGVLTLRRQLMADWERNITQLRQLVTEPPATAFVRA